MCCKYATSNGLVNGVEGIFKTSTTYCEFYFLWIMFQNFKIGTLTKKIYTHYYDNNIESKWTPTKPIIKIIRASKS